MSTGCFPTYYLTNLHPGGYRLEIEKSGFKKLIKPDVTLHVQDALELDFEMALGSASESISVEPGAPVVDAEAAAVSTVIDRRFVENISVNGTSFKTLLMLTPGVVVTATAFDDQGQFSFNANAPVPTISWWTGSAPILMLRVPTAGANRGGIAARAQRLGGDKQAGVSGCHAEFLIQRSSFAPEFGRTPGVQISIVTRP